MLPPAHEIVADAVPLRPWVQWFARVGAVVGANTSSGVTADRPASGLWIGRRYFDTTLGKPVYVKSLGPVVWVDGAGTTS